jgi:Tfp pilus assembly protein PilF
MRWRLPLPILFLALAGCATVSNPSASDQDKPLYPGSQSNVASLSEVIAAHPDDPQAYNMRGVVYGEAGSNEPALADFNKAISLDPNYAQAYANRALVYRKIKKFDLALADDN